MPAKRVTNHDVLKEFKMLRNEVRSSNAEIKLINLRLNTITTQLLQITKKLVKFSDGLVSDQSSSDDDIMEDKNIETQNKPHQINSDKDDSLEIMNYLYDKPDELDDPILFNAYQNTPQESANNTNDNIPFFSFQNVELQINKKQIV